MNQYWRFSISYRQFFVVTKFVTRKIKLLFSLGKIVFRRWDQAYDQIVKPDHIFKKVVVIKFSLLQQYILDLLQTAHPLN